MAIHLRCLVALLLCLTWRAPASKGADEDAVGTDDWLSPATASAPLDMHLPRVSYSAAESEAETYDSEEDNCPSCDGGCEDCRAWTVHADAVFLQRQTPRARALVTDSYLAGGNVLLNANEFPFRMAAGFALDVIRHNVRCSGWDLEGAFLDVDGFSAGRDTFYSPGGGVSQFQTPMGNTFFPADISGVYHSQLRSVELNARRPWNDWLTILGGFRYLDLREQGLQLIHDILATSTNRAIIDVQAANHLAGLQTGFDALVFKRNRLEVGTLLKAGVYNNETANATSITQQAGQGFQCASSATRMAFVGDLQIAATYQVTDALLARGGYQALWISGVATAPNQMAVSDPLNGTATVDAGSKVFYQGLFLGLEYRR